MGDITRGALIAGAATVAAGVTVGVVAQKNAPGGESTAAAAPTLTASKIGGAIPLDGGAQEWKGADRLTVAVKPQQVATPMLEAPSLGSAELRALYNDKEIAALVRFRAREPEDLPGLAAYGDAVAMQLPLRTTDNPPVTMGGPGAPVHVMRWSSVWQRDVDRGRSGVPVIYPNVVRDVSPETLLPPKTAILWSPGLAVGNPMSALRREWPVEEAFAEGFGTLTPMPAQRARAAGRHSEGHWSVVIAAPVDRRPAGDVIGDQASVKMAFALWIGAAGNHGSRKHYTEWVECKLS